VDYHELLVDVQGVLDTLTPIKLEVRAASGAWFLLSIRPYRTSDNVVEGAVITFTEVTELKDARAAIRESESMRLKAAAVLDAQDGIIVQDLSGRILAWNAAAVRMYGWTEAEALAMNISAVIPEDHRDQSLAVIQRLSQAELLEPYSAPRLAKDGQIVDVTLTATALLNGAKAVYAVSTTERGRANDQLGTER
jgi:two-component system CheB/CheR fusion protein